MLMNEIPRIGVAIIVKKDHCVLLGKRLSPHGNGCWGFPGGHLEHGESVFDCAKRETFEETGVILKNLIKEPYTEDFFSDSNKHYITLFVSAEIESGTPQIKEPNKSQEWKWFEWNDLPKPLFTPIARLHELGYTPY